MLIEHALEIWLRYSDHPEVGDKLAADYCQNYDSRYGNRLNGPSQTKIVEIVRFMFTFEVLFETLDDLIGAFRDVVRRLTSHRDRMTFMFEHDNLTRKNPKKSLRIAA